MLYCVLYLLLPSTVLCARHQVFVCEGSTLELACSAGRSITVMRANYGRFSSSVCPGSDTTNTGSDTTNTGSDTTNTGSDTTNTECIQPTTLRQIQALCGGRRSCSVAVSSTVFGDPCTGTSKYLQLLYTCTEQQRTEPEYEMIPLWRMSIEELVPSLSQTTPAHLTTRRTTEEPNEEFLKFVGTIEQEIVGYQEPVSSVNRKLRPEERGVLAAPYSLSNDPDNTDIILLGVAVSLLVCTILIFVSVVISHRVRKKRVQNMMGNYLQSQERSAYSQYITNNTVTYPNTNYSFFLGEKLFSSTKCHQGKSSVVETPDIIAPSRTNIQRYLFTKDDLTRNKEAKQQQHKKLSFMYV